MKKNDLLLIKDMTEEEKFQIEQEIANGTCKIGYSDLETAEKNKLTPEEVSKLNSQPRLNAAILHLHRNMTRWAVYPGNVPPVTGNQIGYLSPSQFGGLSYRIMWSTEYKDVVCIWTESYGYVNIYAPIDWDSCRRPGSPCQSCYNPHHPDEYNWNVNHNGHNHYGGEIIG